MLLPSHPSIFSAFGQSARNIFMAGLALIAAFVSSFLVELTDSVRLNLCD